MAPLRITFTGHPRLPNERILTATQGEAKLMRIRSLVRGAGGETSRDETAQKRHLGRIRWLVTQWFGDASDAMTAKPSLFLSHAAVDHEIVGALKAILVQRTVGSLEVFQSSDGESIPFGRNWVYEIEEALKRARLMFVFISPAALTSTWLPFEAGHAYSRDIRVVPVGIGGVDLAKIPPPLSLLQGFNLSVPEAMNNFLAIINKVFDLRLPETLGEEEFEVISTQYNFGESTIFGRHSHLVDEIGFSVSTSVEPDPEALGACLQGFGIESYVDSGYLYSNGLQLPLHKGHCRVLVDPLLSAITFAALEEMIPLMVQRSSIEEFTFEITLHNSVRAVDALHKLTARIFGTDVVPTSGGRLRLGNLYFKLRQHYAVTGSTKTGGVSVTHTRPNGSSIECTFASPKLQEVPLEEALEALLRAGVLYVGDGEG